MSDDFDLLYDKFKSRKAKSKLKQVGKVDPIKLPIWKEVKATSKFSDCMVCGLQLDNEEIVEACHHCGRFFHYKHIREWLKIKGTCPACKQ